jgi:regulator of protease activity HflC (stomatin/prohibitin superfamily)
MDSAFAWIGYLMDWFGKFIPRILIVRATHAGVKFVGGSKVRELKPGIHFYWPLTTEVEVVPVARQTYNLVSQVLMTKDKQQIVVGAVVIYKIINIVDALSNNWDVNDTIGDVTQMAVVKVVNQWPLDEILAQLTDKVELELSKETRAKLKRYGVEVERCGFTDFSTCLVIKTLADAGPAPMIIPK